MRQVQFRSKKSKVCFFPHIRTLADEVRRHGATPEISITGKNHIRIGWKGGRIYVGLTPSGPLTVNNKRAEIRRKFREVLS
jgi:hypothetical protein